MANQLTSRGAELLEYAFHELAEETEPNEEDIPGQPVDIGWITSVGRNEQNGAIEVRGNPHSQPLSGIDLLRKLRSISDLRDYDAEVVAGNVTSVALLASAALHKLRMEAQVEERDLKQTHLKIVRGTAPVIALSALRALIAANLLSESSLEKISVIRYITYPNPRTILPSVREWLDRKNEP